MVVCTGVRRVQLSWRAFPFAGCERARLGETESSSHELVVASCDITCIFLFSYFLPIGRVFSSASYMGHLWEGEGREGRGYSPSPLSYYLFLLRLSFESFSIQTEREDVPFSHTKTTRYLRVSASSERAGAYSSPCEQGTGALSIHGWMPWVFQVLPSIPFRRPLNLLASLLEVKA